MLPSFQQEHPWSCRGTIWIHPFPSCQEMGNEPLLGGPQGRIPKKGSQGAVLCGARGIWGEGGTGHWHREADAISEVPVPRGNGGQADVTVTEPFK